MKTPPDSIVNDGKQTARARAVFVSAMGGRIHRFDPNERAPVGRIIPMQSEVREKQELSLLEFARKLGARVLQSIRNAYQLSRMDVKNYDE